MSDDGTEPLASAGIRRWQAPEHAVGPHGTLTASRLAEIEEQAYDEGFRRGLDEGLREGQSQVASKARRLEQLFQAIEPQAALLDEAMLDQISELVLAIARQLVRRELSREPGEVVAVVRDALTVLPVSDSEIRIAVHPEDAALIRDTLKTDTLTQPIRVNEDLSLSRGGARVETEVSVVDASVEARFGAIAANVFGDRRGSRPVDDDQ